MPVIYRFHQETDLQQLLYGFPQFRRFLLQFCEFFAKRGIFGFQCVGILLLSLPVFFTRFYNPN